jgi:DNA replication protein DnaC
MELAEQPFNCNICRDVGLIPTERGSRPCACQIDQQARMRLTRAGIPPKFQDCALENFTPEAHTSWALAAARRYVTDFLPGAGRGILFTGNVGAGKTHLAAGILRALIEDKGIQGQFVIVPRLLEKLRATFGPDATETDTQILKPILSADLVVIDELGASRPTDWVLDTVELLIGGLYNRSAAVIVTTNFLNLGFGASQVQDENEYARAARAETLGDRIGKRMWSRLQQMCTTVVQIHGSDWRAKQK